MNTSKSLWINRPTGVTTTLHSYTFTPVEKAEVYFILEREGKIEITCKRGCFDYILLHTPNDYVLFKENSIEVVFKGLKEEMQIKRGDKITLDKRLDRLTFSYDEREVLSLSYPSFLTSTSFGVRAYEGKEVYLEVF